MAALLKFGDEQVKHIQVAVPFLTVSKFSNLVGQKGSYFFFFVTPSLPLDHTVIHTIDSYLLLLV